MRFGHRGVQSSVAAPHGGGVSGLRRRVAWHRTLGGFASAVIGISVVVTGRIAKEVSQMVRVRVLKPKPSRPTPSDLDLRTPSGRPLPF